MLTKQAAPATEPQQRFIRTLIAERQWDQARVLEIAPTREYSKPQASELITYLKGCPKKKGGGVEDLVTEAGMYKQGDRIFKVQLAVHGSGKLYAKELILEEPNCGGCANDEPCGAGCKWTARFVYRPGAISRLRASDLMSLEEAKEFGALYGTCCVCGRTLTKEESIEAGIGPICAGKGNWG